MIKIYNGNCSEFIWRLTCSEKLPYFSLREGAGSVQSGFSAGQETISILYDRIFLVNEEKEAFTLITFGFRFVTANRTESYSLIFTYLRYVYLCLGMLMYKHFLRFSRGHGEALRGGMLKQ